MPTTFAQKQNEPQPQTSLNQKPQTAPSSKTHSDIDQIMHLQRTIGNRAVQRLLQANNAEALELNSDITSLAPTFHSAEPVLWCSDAPTKVQPKLSVNAPGDRHEREADEVADRIMRMPDMPVRPQDEVSVKTESPHIQRMCSSCEEEEQPQIQRRESNNEYPEVQPSLSAQIERGGGGNPLPAATRSFFEPRFGSDFSQVRVHTDAQAVQLSRSLHAEAFTYGKDIYFNEQRFAPESTGGKRLLAHELAHTIQQRGAVERKIQRREVCDEAGVCHSEADPEPNQSVVPRAGASLMPPGDCSWGEHRALQNAVDEACDRERRCTQNDDCATIWQRIQFNAECIRARTTINARCFRGGDAGHIIALGNALGALAHCWAVYNRRCQPRTPPVPVPVPVPEERPRPIVDRGFMERMAAITGLTGTALVIYIIVSEGSRLFPPRNLVPIP